MQASRKSYDSHGRGFREIEIVDDDSSDTFGKYRRSESERAATRRWAKENPDRVRAYTKFWNNSPVGRARKDRWANTPKGILYRIEYAKVYNKSANRKAVVKRYNSKPERKAYMKRYTRTPEFKARRKETCHRYYLKKKAERLATQNGVIRHEGKRIPVKLYSKV